MSILTFSNLRKSFADVDIFIGLGASIPQNAAIGLVGPNGIGKTTLLRILAGKSQPSEGAIHVAKETCIGYLQQEAVHAFAAQENSVYEEMLTVFAELRQQEAQLREMEMAMTNPDVSESLLAEYGAAQEAFELAGGYDYELRIQQVLEGLGFSSTDWQMPLTHCSGGQKTRALLARLLLEEPDLLILDEPTNHLDVVALEWLENRLRTWEGAMLIVSHDRYFLDKVVNTIWEMSANGLETYRGNYTAYLHQREERWLRREEEFEATKATFLKELDYIKRNIARDSTTAQAKGRLRRLVRHVKAVEIGGAGVLNQKWSRFMDASGGISGEKWNVAQVEQHIKGLLCPTSRHWQMKMRLQVTGHIAHKVLTAIDLLIGYPNNALFRADEIALYGEECVALIGPNGSGKSTFLRTLLGEIESLEGELQLGASLKMGYFAQAHDKLNPENTVIEELMAHSHGMLPAQARHYLAPYLFRGEDVFKPVSALSGGERGRLTLAILALDEVNFLILDEPTNHLDLPTQEVLEEALLHFGGTILLVTHDRYLINQLATQIWELREEHLHIHDGNYASYLAAREQAVKQAEEAKARASANDKQNSQRQKKAETRGIAKELAQIEDRIHELETILSVLAEDLETAAKAQQLDRIKILSQSYKETEAQLEMLMAKWETLSESS